MLAKLEGGRGEDRRHRGRAGRPAAVRPPAEMGFFVESGHDPLREALEAIDIDALSQRLFILPALYKIFSSHYFCHFMHWRHHQSIKYYLILVCTISLLLLGLYF